MYNVCQSRFLSSNKSVNKRQRLFDQRNTVLELLDFSKTTENHQMAETSLKLVEQSLKVLKCKSN